MTYPNRLRVSPSGTFASDDTVPLNELAGAICKVADTFADQVIGKIGPSDNVGTATSLLLRIGSASGVSPDANSANLVWGSPKVELTPGIWLIELDLGVGYFSAPPSDANSGALSAAFMIAKDDGSAYPIQTTIVESPVPVSQVGTFGVSARHTKLSAAIVVTEEDITNNAGATIENVYVRLSRVNGSPYGGTYGTTSGYLEVTRDTVVSLRKLPSA